MITNRVNRRLVIFSYLIMTYSTSVLATSRTENTSSSSYDFSASILWDADLYQPLFSNNASENITETEFRRIRFSLKSKYNDFLASKIQVDYDSDKQDYEFKDVYLSFIGIPNVKINFGQEKEPLGLEKNNSLRKSLFIERSLVTQALAPGRNKGVSIAQNSQTWFWKIGYYQPDTPKDTVKTNAITARIGWSPLNKKKNLLHFAISSSYRDLDGNKYRINEKAEVHTSDTIVESKKIKAKTINLNALEFIYQRKSLSLAAEYLQSNVIDTKQRKRRYSGGYWQLGYRITGESHQYKNGKFGGIKPNKSSGAWEIALRKSYLKLDKESQDIEILTLGFNYYFNRTIKIMLNHLIMDNTDKGINNSGSATTFRFQYNF